MHHHSRFYTTPTAVVAFVLFSAAKEYSNIQFHKSISFQATKEILIPG